ncbi:MmcQ/YjbR family DNA-binding protein [Streptococcus respiraculi]|uniref:MmcQ/YjbR family DNA-binding protein n=1 Tax=Streptococcus respiraculi TaxID=2021971 RepID=UPI000E748FB9|nr:MmcQ/YjbR family DNA-binding protein [Streptococcus respiraculi]
MSLEAEIFNMKRVLVYKLEPFGFHFDGKVYVYREMLLDGTFEAEVTILQSGKVSGRVIDLDMKEEYLNLRMEYSVGGFVGQVREAYLKVLEKIAEICFEEQPFSSQQGNRLVQYLTKKTSDVYDHPFKRERHYISYRVAGKWYLVGYPLKREKLDSSEKKIGQIVDVINIKVSLETMAIILSKKGVYPAYHMSKKYWVSIILDDSLSDEELFTLVLESRNLLASRKQASKVNVTKP